MSYGNADLGAMKDDMTSHSGRRYYKVTPAPQNCYLCPPWSAEQKLPWYRAMVHFQLDKGPVRCLKEFGLPCDACIANSELFTLKDTNEAAKKISAEIYAKPVFFYNMIPNVGITPDMQITCMDPKDNQSPMVVPYMASKKVQDLLVNFYTSNGNIFDPNNAMILNFMAIKNGNFSQTFVTINTNQRARLAPHLLNLLGSLPNLSNEVPQGTPEAMKRLVESKLANFRATQVRPVSMYSPPMYAQPSAPMVQGQMQNPQAAQYPPMQQPVPQQFAPQAPAAPAPSAPPWTPPVQTAQVPQGQVPPWAVQPQPTNAVAPSTPPVPTYSSSGLDAFEAALKAQQANK